ncbi:uncharacterized protein LOC115654624 [Gopherus evgoodei]|uniref:uncharacterized protein LOC115654624 n=1 Tax=Gopherus evgoodei TaxID=1825980 RepID=UPI0011CF9E4E|nr:uncharacterized protein LOC115654624 [Gopherus evgoodei]
MNGVRTVSPEDSTRRVRPVPSPVGRISTEAVRRDRLRVGWEGLGGQVARCRGAASVTAPGPHLSPPPGAEGDDRRRAFPHAAPCSPAASSPLSLPPPLAGEGGCGRRGVGLRQAGRRAGDGPPLCSRRDCQPGRTVLSAPRPRRAAGRGGATPGRPGSAAMSATHPTRLETRTKESNTCASQRLDAKAHGAMKVRAGAGRLRWDPEATAEGAPPARLTRPVGEVEHERTC